MTRKQFWAVLKQMNEQMELLTDGFYQLTVSSDIADGLEKHLRLLRPNKQVMLWPDPFDPRDYRVVIVDRQLPLGTFIWHTTHEEKR